MRVALLTTFTTGKKEPLVEVMNRVRKAFSDAGLAEPQVRFNFGDSVVTRSVSSVDRVLKRYPELKRFVTDAEPMPGIRGARRISNGPASLAAGETVPYETLQAIVAGVPRSFPFHNVVIHFVTHEFGTLGLVSPRSADLIPGVLLSDRWWVNGRNRSLSTCAVLEAEPSSKTLPPLPKPVAAIFAAFGKAKRTVQVPVPDEEAFAHATPVPLPIGGQVVSANPQAAQAVKPVVADYRARMPQIVADARLPHDLPPSGEAVQPVLGVTAGPLKPVLAGAFAPMGYSCKGSSGTFTLRRRSAANLSIELSIDVGTWSHSTLAIFKVLGVGFRASLRLPVSPRAVVGLQYPIGDADQWAKIVDNLAALVKELDQTFVPAVELAGGPTPEWYRPES